MKTVILVAALLGGLLLVPPQARSAPVVRLLSRDTLDQPRTGQETFPAPERNINGRAPVLQESDVDGMAWGSTDDGLGQRWAGGTGNQLDWRTQASGLGALTAAQ